MLILVALVTVPMAWMAEAGRRQAEAVARLEASGAVVVYVSSFDKDKTSNNAGLPLGDLAKWLLNALGKRVVEVRIEHNHALVEIGAINSLPSLQRLTLSDCTLIDDAAIRNVVEHNRGIEEICIDDCPRVSNVGIATLTTLPKLRRVFLGLDYVNSPAVLVFQASGVSVEFITWRLWR